MLSNANLSKNFWGETVVTATYVINRSPSTTIGLKTPEEKWSGHPPNLENLRVFGYVAYAHINQGKLEPRALKCMFLGYPERVKGYRLWCLENGQPKIIISRDVIFREAKMYHPKDKKQENNEQPTKIYMVQLEVESRETTQKAKTDSV